jgi:ERCC4-type nuclease
MLEFIIDNREHISETLKNKLEKLKNDTSVINITNLPIGDYQFNWNNNPVLVIERKTIADYAASIKDGRHREQKGRLLSSFNKSKIMYLIEGDLTHNNSSYKFNNVSKDTIISAIFNTILRDQIQVFHTVNTDETVEVIISLFIKIQKQGITFIEEQKESYNDNLVDTAKITKGGNMTPEISFRMMLNCIPSVSNKVSSRIIKHHDTMNNFIECLKEIDTKENRIKYISNLKIDEKDNRISVKTCENILSYIGVY